MVHRGQGGTLRAGWYIEGGVAYGTVRGVAHRGRGGTSRVGWYIEGGVAYRGWPVLGGGCTSARLRRHVGVEVLVCVAAGRLGEPLHRPHQGHIGKRDLRERIRLCSTRRHAHQAQPPCGSLPPHPQKSFRYKIFIKYKKVRT